MKVIIKKLFNKLGLSITRYPYSLSKYIKVFKNWRGIPWTKNYQTAKFGQILNTLDNPELSKVFSDCQKLPEKFGHGFDERCIEYPWLFNRLPKNIAHILDAGSVLNFDVILEQPIFQKAKLDILTLAPEHNCFFQKGISYLYHDLRNIPIKDNFYDVVVCLSTLEHVGCDNRIYTADPNYVENKFDDFTKVMQELHRVLKPDGSLFLSVPYGKYKNYGLFQQFDRPLLDQAIAAFGDTKQITETFYKYSEDGWQISTPEACADCEYAQWVVNLWQTGQKPSKQLVDPDYAAAARAVACVQLIK